MNIDELKPVLKDDKVYPVDRLYVYVFSVCILLAIASIVIWYQTSDDRWWWGVLIPLAVWQVLVWIIANYTRMGREDRERSKQHKEALKREKALWEQNNIPWIYDESLRVKTWEQRKRTIQAFQNLAREDGVTGKE
ncbi:hypothetical protein [Flaviaesturariibacter amylovorans]|uniref:2TM domain-containing protein n=1 Tax=Flaviaesturariibacter amylovorans TaxID=1084520 RepID=A0ABP8G4E5_9BACT